MMEEPGWRGGRLISPRPQRGPEAIMRRSFMILDMLTMQIFSAEDTSR